MKILFSFLILSFSLSMGMETPTTPNCTSTLDQVTIELQTLDGILTECVEPNTDYKLVIKRNATCFKYYCVNGLYGVVNSYTGSYFYQCQDANPVNTFYFSTNGSGVDIEFFISGYVEMPDGSYQFQDEISVSYSNGNCDSEQY